HQRRSLRPLRDGNARPRRRRRHRRLLARRQRDLDRKWRARIPGPGSDRLRQSARDARGHRRGRRRSRFPLLDGGAHLAIRRVGRERRVRALLFDHDGTLTQGGGGGGRALAKALHTRPQASEELRRMRLDGMTDRAIARLVLTAERKSVSERDIDAVLEQYLHALATEVAERPYVPLPGVSELLRRLDAKALLGLCTGNHVHGAELKLSSAGLWGCWKFGGYGSDAEPRVEIVR